MLTIVDMVLVLVLLFLCTLTMGRSQLVAMGLPVVVPVVVDPEIGLSSVAFLMDELVAACFVEVGHAVVHDAHQLSMGYHVPMLVLMEALQCLLRHASDVVTLLAVLVSVAAAVVALAPFCS